MGNQLVGIAPSQIFPVEHYLSELPDIQFDVNLGSTRFLKVARARSQEGLLVVKVFAIHDPTLPLKDDMDTIDKIRNKLADTVNCLAFQKTVLTDKAGFLMREYVKYSLYDRISTRPFLLGIEKKWIAFQLLYALHQCHRQGVCHGDIKLENLLITSWHWLLLSDFASYKPTYLPDDNPADFSYFFDTSRRRTCYLAPERFVRANTAGDVANEAGVGMLSEGGVFLDAALGALLEPAMDIFSAGCVLAELFSDGCIAPLFDLSQLLAYRSGEYSPDHALDKLEEPRAAALIRAMIDMNPARRASAESLLSAERGKLFPEYFYTFLQSYMLIFSTHDPILSSDEKIERLKKDIHNIISIVTAPQTAPESDSSTQPRDKSPSPVPLTETQLVDTGEDTEYKSTEDRLVSTAERLSSLDISGTGRERASNEGVETKEKTAAASTKKVTFSTASSSSKEDPLVLITSLVTSCIRGLHFPSSKQSALSILVDISRVCTGETILDRMLPYVVYLLGDTSCRVRADAVHCLTQCLQGVSPVLLTDNNNNAHVFPEYVLPCVDNIVEDESVIVRTALAQNIATLAETGLKFLEHTQLLATATSVAGGNQATPQPHSSYENELATLHDSFQKNVAKLLTDSQSIVKQTLIENGAITKLCIFFGKQKTNDFLLSHMITFLNDKHNTELRASFFDNIVGVAAYIGIHISSMLTPLLLQGFVDEEEFIARKALNALTSLTQLSLLDKPCLFEILNKTCCLLVHPNLWIRHSMVAFISSLSSCKHLNPVDIQCKVLPLIKPYIKYSIIQLDKQVILLNALKTPLPRNMYTTASKHATNDLFLYTLGQRFKSKGAGANSGAMAQISGVLNELNVEGGISPNQSSAVSNVFRKLSSEGITEEHEVYILLLAKHLRTCARNATSKTNQATGTQEDVVNSTGEIVISGVQSHSVVLGENTHSSMKKVDMNEEWKHMFHASRPLVKHNTMLCSDTSTSELSSSSDPNVNSVQERSYIQYHYAPCKIELRKLISRHQELHSAHFKDNGGANILGGVVSRDPSPLPPPKWRLRSILVAHLHEHRGGVTRIENIPGGSLVASASWDSTVKLWDLAKIEGKSIANRSICSVNTQAGVINAMTICDQNRSLAVSNASTSAKGQISIVRLDRMESSSKCKMNIFTSRTLAECPSDLGRFDNNVVVYSCLTGQICGWDLRVSNNTSNAWTLDNDLKKGAIFAMHVDSKQYQLVVGTSLGSFTCWDLRFRLPVSTFSHPHNLRVRRIIGHPSASSCIITSMQDNNEVSVWNLESGVRLSTFWSAPTPPLSNAAGGAGPQHTVCGLYAAGTAGKRNGFLLACGTDQRVRYWGLDNPNESYLAIPSGFEYNNPPTLSYEYNLIDGIRTAQEISIRSEVRSPVPPTRSTTEDSPRAGPEQVVPGHYDVITDLTLGQASQCLLVTGSNDGVIKVWK